MDFNGFNPPDPEQVLQSLERLRDAFQAAADNSAAASKPAFTRLSDAFNNVTTVMTTVDLEGMMQGGKPDFGAIIKVVAAVKGFHGAMNEVQTLAKTDTDAAKTFDTLTTAVRAEAQNLGGGMIGGLGDFGGDIFGKGPEAEETPTPPKKPRIKKPKDGDFDL